MAAVEEPALPPPASQPLTANLQATPRNAFTELMTTSQLSLGMVCLALAVAAGLGAFHALEPGHGKTVVAAYLVGTRGTARDALYLGLIVTSTHTAGVYLLGAVTLYASHYVVPERLYPWLGVVSGLIIAGLGGCLFLRRYAGEAHTHAHAHTHPHRHTHAHVHGQAHVHHDSSHHKLAHHHHPHSHGAPQEHHHERSQAVSFRQLLALGVTGGIVPCPAALVVLLSAFALHRVGFGLLLIVAFSVGLAAVLIAIGLAMVYARHLFSPLAGRGAIDHPLAALDVCGHHHGVRHGHSRPGAGSRRGAPDTSLGEGRAAVGTGADAQGYRGAVVYCYAEHKAGRWTLTTG